MNRQILESELYIIETGEQKRILDLKEEWEKIQNQIIETIWTQGAYRKVE